MSKPQSVPNSALADVQRMVEEGMIRREIADELGVSLNSITWFMKKVGIRTKRGRRRYGDSNPIKEASKHSRLDGKYYQPKTDLTKRDPLLELLRIHHGR